MYRIFECWLYINYHLVLSSSFYLFFLQSSTIGLVTLDEMKAKQENIVKEREKKLAQKQLEKERERQRQLEAKQAEKNRQKKQVSDNNE